MEGLALGYQGVFSGALHRFKHQGRFSPRLASHVAVKRDAAGVWEQTPATRVHSDLAECIRIEFRVSLLCSSRVDFLSQRFPSVMMLVLV